MPFLRQSTSQTIRFGPCLDATDGVTEETALTLAQADMRLSKDGGAFAQKNAAGNATHDSDGWYSTTLNTTDTNTVGELILNVHQPANMLPVWMRFWVLEEAIYDALFGASAAGFDSNQRVDIGSVLGTAQTAGDLMGSIGEENAAAAAGDPSTTESVMQYVKQIINILAGTAGVATYPAEAAPGNAVSLAEVIRAIHTDVTGLNGDAMRGTDSAALASVCTEARLAELDAANLPTDVAGVQSDTDDIQTRLPAALVSGKMDSDMTSISGDSVAADRLEGLMDGIILAQVNDASATTTAFAADGFTEATDDHFNGRLITFITGALAGQQTDITDYDAAGHTQGSQAFVVTALTEAPANNDWFVIH